MSLTILFLATALFTTNAQSIIGAMPEREVDMNAYRALILTEHSLYRGTILSISDTGVIIVESRFNREDLFSSAKLVPVSIFLPKDITYFSIRKKFDRKNLWKSTGIGFLAGAGVSFWADDLNEPHNILGGALIGACIGMIIGNSSLQTVHRLHLNGDEKLYAKHFPEIEVFSMKELDLTRILKSNVF